MKKVITTAILVFVLLFNCVYANAANLENQMKDYIHSVREVQDLDDAAESDGSEAQWITVVKPIPKPDGIPVKDAFNSDDKKIAFLTFDDGPSSNVTPAILDILKENNIKATFFVVGSMAKNNSDIIKRIYADGHTIANHSYSHQYSYLYASANNFMEEINACDSVLKNILGQDFETKIFRFPGGAFGNSYSSYKTVLSEHGYDYINWNALSGDAEGNNIPADRLVQSLIGSVEGKDDVVVLMHDLGTKHTTVQALPRIIEYLKSQGYEFNKLI